MLPVDPCFSGGLNAKGSGMHGAEGPLLRVDRTAPGHVKTGRCLPGASVRGPLPEAGEAQLMVRTSLWISWLSCVWRSLSFFFRPERAERTMVSGRREPHDSTL